MIIQDDIILALDNKSVELMLNLDIGSYKNL